MWFRRWMALLTVLVFALTLAAAAQESDAAVVAAPMETAVEEAEVELYPDGAESDLAAPERSGPDSAVMPTEGSLVTITRPASGATVSPGNVEFWARFDNSAFSGTSDVWKFASIRLEVLKDGADFDAQTLGVSGNVSFAGDGRQYATLSLTQPGEYTLRASVPGSPDVWDSVTFTVVGASATTAPGGGAWPSDVPRTSRQPVTDDNMVIITSPAHNSVLDAGSCRIKARFNVESAKFDKSMYDRVKFEIVNCVGGDAFDFDYEKAAKTGEEIKLYDYDFELGGVYTIRARVGDEGVWDSVNVYVNGPAYYPGKDGEGRYSITPNQSEYTLDLAKGDTVRVGFTLSSAADPAENRVFSTDYIENDGEVISRAGYNRSMHGDYPDSYDAKTGLWTCEGWNEYKGHKVGTGKLHLYILVGERYDHHEVTIHVIDSSKDITRAKFTVKDQTFTGKALEPAVMVELNGKALKQDTDYTVSYKNNTAIGKATVTVTGKGKYTGTSKGFFRIKPKKVSGLGLKAGKKQLTVSWKKASGVTGYQVQYGLKKDFTGAKKVTVKKAATVQKVLKNLKAKKTYYVRVRAYRTVKGVDYYSAWSKAVKKKTK